MYLRERIRQIPPGHFIEIGPGSGEITRLLLDHRWSGRSYDLEAKTIVTLRERFAKEITEHRFTPINDDFLSLPPRMKRWIW
jgi:16S rRNA A1518/A1519 N6-dimethyltransferase RsmA/KsgA/DIM1 with predicted DNA glycosylase/AP lyase activity